MEFNILYVENEKEDFEKIALAIEQSREQESESGRSRDFDLILHRADSPEALEGVLNLRTDLVLADVLFDYPATGQYDEPRLDAIIDVVSRWSEEEEEGRKIPIIAYTKRSPVAFEIALVRSDELYDIWDKNTVSPGHVAWRLKKLAVELRRTRPDSLMQRLIREMVRGCRWHNHVVEMAQRYDSGWTEADQIQRAGKAIKGIADDLGNFESCDQMWDIMIEWESIGRAVSRRTRGHARHVINVFWMGYWLLFSRSLMPYFRSAGKALVADRPGMTAVMELDPMEVLADAWFYAALFHDVGSFVEKWDLVSKAQTRLFRLFDLEIWGETAAKTSAASTVFAEEAGGVLEFFKEPLKSDLQRVFNASREDGQPDHGVVGAAHVVRIIRGDVQNAVAREAARAMILHNMFSKLPVRSCREVTWKREPIACLLLLCDQLQTWDRERGDRRLSDPDAPQRAELGQLEISSGRPAVVHVGINYIVPAHLGHAITVYKRVRDDLEQIIRENPGRALNRLGEPWPFGLDVRFWLSGDLLSVKLVKEGRRA